MPAAQASWQTPQNAGDAGRVWKSSGAAKYLAVGLDEKHLTRVSGRWAALLAKGDEESSQAFLGSADGVPSFALTVTGEPLFQSFGGVAIGIDRHGKQEYRRVDVEPFFDRTEKAAQQGADGNAIRENELDGDRPAIDEGAQTRLAIVLSDDRDIGQGLRGKDPEAVVSRGGKQCEYWEDHWVTRIVLATEGVPLAEIANSQ